MKPYNNAANNRRRRAQGALEYLMSYGWAIGVVILMGGALYSLGLFNPATFIGSRSATGFTTLQIKDWALGQDTFTFLLGNKYGEQITVTAINATRKGTSYSCIYNTPAKELPVGTEAAFSISDPSLVLDLSMDSANSADNSTLDSSIHSNTARLFNYTRSCFGPSACPKQATGRINSALQLDGADDYINVSASGSLDTITSQLTIEAWLNTNSLSKRQTIVANWFYNKTAVPNIGSRSYVLSLGTSGKFDFELSPIGDLTGAAWLTSTTGISGPGGWVHVAAVSNGTNASIYLNGVLDGTGGSPPNLYVPHLPVYVGMWFAEEANKDPYTTFFNGTLDEVRIYNRALPPDEINRHYNLNYGAGCSAGLSKGRPYTLDVKIDFASQSGIPHTDFGTITGKVE